MNRTSHRGLTVLSLLASAGPAFGQSPSVDERIGDVERRVTTVERVVGVAPDAKAQAIEAGPAPLGVFLDATDAIVVDQLGDTRVTWDFGDNGSPRDQMNGFNAAHAYDRPGRYLITRVVDAPAGRSSKTYAVEVTAAARRSIHVSSDGDDALNGATPATAVRSWGRAAALLGGGIGSSNAQVLLRRGDRFPMSSTLALTGENVRVASYGDASLARPTIVVDIARSPSIVMIAMRGVRCAIEGVAFDSVGWNGGDTKGMPFAINAGGRGLIVRDCAFLNVGYAINGNGVPDGVLLEQSEAPLPGGLRGYLTWIQGTNWCVLDNRAINSTREHILRVGSGERLNIQGNVFDNLDRRPDKTDGANGIDPGDYSKSTINVQAGRIAYVAGNVLTDGDVTVGPLGGGDGISHPQDRFLGAVFENNRVRNATMQVQHGAQFVTFRNNLITRNGTTAIKIYGYDAKYQRGVADVTIEHNTVTNNDIAGQFIDVGAGATRLSLIDNLYAATRLHTGAYDAAAVFVHDGDLSAFAKIDGNRWPTVTSNTYAHGGVNYVSVKAGGAAGYVDPAQWKSMVPGDAVVPIASTDVVTLDGAGVDASLLPPIPTTEPATQPSRETAAK